MGCKGVKGEQGRGSDRGKKKRHQGIGTEGEEGSRDLTHIKND